VLLLDTSVLVSFERELAQQRVGAIRSFLGSHRTESCACTTVTVGELAAGAPEGAVRFLVRRFRRIPLTEAIALRAGELERELSRVGKRLGENDNWIAATALHLSATLVFTDGDFLRVPKLKARRLEG
jgi:predicted nucleic acid-binding protein